MSANCFSLWEISSPDPLPGLRPWAHWELPFSRPPELQSPKLKFLAPPLHASSTLVRRRSFIHTSLYFSGKTFSANWNLLSLTLWRSVKRRQIGHFFNFHGLPGCSFRISYADPGPDLRDDRRGHDPGLPPRLPPRMGLITTNIDIDSDGVFTSTIFDVTCYVTGTL